MKFCPVCGTEYEGGKVCDADGAVLVQPQPTRVDDLLGKVLKESYRIEEKIGEGGMGAVFRGVQITLERNVAIKVLMPGMQSTPSIIQRFFREARLLSQLSHPNIVGIIDFGHTEEGMVYMVMEYLVGATLDELVPTGDGLDAPRLVGLMRQIGSGVASAHRRKLVHRDLKPDNIFITQSTGEESVKILDFGIARALEAEGQPRLTQKGMLMGTPGFLAPEQIQSLDADGRSDIYALGALLYFMITGRRPFTGDSPHAVFAHQLRNAPPIDTDTFGDRLPLGEVVLRAMRIEPDERFQTADEMMEDLESTAIAAGLIDEPSRAISLSRGIPIARPVEREPAADARSSRHAAEPTRILQRGDAAETGPRPGPWLKYAILGLALLALAAWLVVVL